MNSIKCISPSATHLCLLIGHFNDCQASAIVCVTYAMSPQFRTQRLLMGCDWWRGYISAVVVTGASVCISYASVEHTDLFPAVFVDARTRWTPFPCIGSISSMVTCVPPIASFFLCDGRQNMLIVSLLKIESKSEWHTWNISFLLTHHTGSMRQVTRRPLVSRILYGMWNVPEILPAHAVQDEIDAEICHEKLLSNTLSDHKVHWILDFVLDGMNGEKAERGKSFRFNNHIIDSVNKAMLFWFCPEKLT